MKRITDNQSETDQVYRIIEISDVKSNGLTLLLMSFNLLKKNNDYIVKTETI